MKLKDAEKWEQFVEANRDDGYGECVLRYIERWAEQMELAFDAGESMAECAKRTRHTADTEGITGFMYWCAVSVLAQVWEHGEELRRWHNLDTQIGTEGEKANESGGVLNPALLSVGGDQ